MDLGKWWFRKDLALRNSTHFENNTKTKWIRVRLQPGSSLNKQLMSCTGTTAFRRTHSHATSRIASLAPTSTHFSGLWPESLSGQLGRSEWWSMRICNLQEFVWSVFGKLTLLFLFWHCIELENSGGPVIFRVIHWNSTAFLYMIILVDPSSWEPGRMHCFLEVPSLCCRDGRFGHAEVTIFQIMTGRWNRSGCSWSVTGCEAAGSCSSIVCVFRERTW